MSEDKQEASEQSIYLLRTTQQHHVQLSLMADHKANMLIGAAFVVFSISVSQVRSGTELSWPLLVLGVSAAISALLAAMAVIPTFEASPKDAHERPNLLFFGAFHRMAEADYIDALEKQMASDDDVYRAMLHDIYQMGQVLAKKKYRYLRWSYSIFMIGIVATLLLFAVDYLARL
ncbi:Pycsar system effector family protein [Alterisphingorhabdus coralli]|uniref:DUF5706 domain-containing protein n=1 Tax=Alterisphingorhabdus coralli TaxID=3071408 RepID=A0AA97F9G2_9SPHN|nr:Pycsar system effector family protein [Parasphingorhabdus sp. SCSIO 66989]WOE75712.1 DUF5706 domain-containing protein [Parasphingorhabdus sp. SCSIO 66989]